jgi:hypothetical protein
MNRNIVFGAGGNEVMRVDGTGLTIQSGYSLNPTSTTTTFTGGITITPSIAYVKSGKKVTWQIGSSGANTLTAAAGFLNGALPSTIKPPTSGFSPTFPVIISVNGVYQTVTVF